MINNSSIDSSDRFTFAGSTPAGTLSPNITNFSFTFIKPTDTVSNNQLTTENIRKLITGNTQISFAGGPGEIYAQGVITGAPEPATMAALSGLVVGGCGIGYRRRVRAKRQESKESDA